MAMLAICKAWYWTCMQIMDQTHGVEWDSRNALSKNRMNREEMVLRKEGYAIRDTTS